MASLTKLTPTNCQNRYWERVVAAGRVRLEEQTKSLGRADTNGSLQGFTVWDPEVTQYLTMSCNINELKTISINQRRVLL